MVVQKINSVGINVADKKRELEYYLFLGRQTCVDDHWNKIFNFM